MADRIPRLGQNKRQTVKQGGSASIRPTGAAWQRLRKTVLDRHPLCVYCFAEGRVTAALIVDHIIALSLGGGSGDDNLISACHDCNQRKAKVESQWARQGLSLANLKHAPPIVGTLKWLVEVARAAKA